ncbi:MAG: glutathionylspermidine synthase family protein [Chloracidobacterium sp.]|uniref:Glutathionylspermidine synthase family protein n=1 Tax=Chloracidobacterium validum TaxID=2821543 RepID=A0ABX8B7D1_9BACT|nr:glutathionylspermidine synthase family protein [Chloracidobacterium validum]QUW02584.1 glutathionylspermidine synthase family protein [Chloracidobacterium validum]
MDDYADFAHAVYATGVLSDPWLWGEPRFRLQGAIISPSLANQLAEAAEAVTYLHQALVEILLDKPEFIASFYQLTPFQRMMWQAAGGMWHGMARADLFLCADGRIQCCELNSDTPSGQPEAVWLNHLRQAAHPGCLDPNLNFPARFLELLRESHAKRTDTPLTKVGIVYPTELTEDLCMIAAFSRWLEAEGIHVVTGSPYNLCRTPTGVALLGQPVDLILRHYKTDWWGERLPVWADAEGYPDDEPLTEPLLALLDADVQEQVTVVNPFGAVVTQNKLSLAFFWEEMERFTPEAQQLIRRFIPETYRLTQISLDRLCDEREQWVLKSDYGCEGAETVCGPFVTPEVWEKAIELALPEHFVAQRFFEVQADNEGWLPNYGVFVLGGGAAGFFTRLSKKSTEYNAVTAPTYISGTPA